MTKFLSSIFVLFVYTITQAQSFHPAAGQPGSHAIAMDSSIIVDWATGITVQRGYFDIANPSEGMATFGAPENGIGPAEGTSVDVVALGDSGVAIITFSAPIMNGEGPDFAIFENGFADNFLELAFVEVSSDGVNYVRFPAISETQTATQIGAFEFSDCRYVNNLAGKYRQGFGTPFDLEELIDSVGIDINSITHVKLIDVIGTIDPQYGSLDSQGNLINDLYPTNFESGGFDLDAVAVIHQAPLSINEFEIEISLFPNPTCDEVTIETTSEHSVEIINEFGQVLETFVPSKKRILSLKKHASHLLFLRIQTSEGTITKRVIIR